MRPFTENNAAHLEKLGQEVLEMEVLCGSGLTARSIPALPRCRARGGRLTPLVWVKSIIVAVGQMAV